MANLSFHNNTMKPIYLLTNFDVNLQPLIHDITGRAVKINMVVCGNYSQELVIRFPSQVVLLPPQGTENIRLVLFGLIGLIFQTAVEISVVYSYQLPEFMRYKIQKNDFVNHFKALRGTYKLKNTWHFLNEISQKVN